MPLEPLNLILQPLNEPGDSEGIAGARQTRLYHLLKAAILDGRLVSGARLPGTRQLAADYRMARNCVLFAYQLLLAEGFVEADRGGTRVAALPLGAAGGPQHPPALAHMLSRRARCDSSGAAGCAADCAFFTPTVGNAPTRVPRRSASRKPSASSCW